MLEFCDVSADEYVSDNDSTEKCSTRKHFMQKRLEKLYH